MIGIRLSKTDTRAIIPTYAHEGDACFDLYAIEDAIVSDKTPVMVRTGLAFEIPDGMVMKVYPRSSLAVKEYMMLANCVGIIDSGYRGEVFVPLIAFNGHTKTVKAGQRIAQAEITRTYEFRFVETDKLTDTERGTGGFGSSGK